MYNVLKYLKNKKVVKFLKDAGTHTLQGAYIEDGNIVISDGAFLFIDKNAGVSRTAFINLDLEERDIKYVDYKKVAKSPEEFTTHNSFKLEDLSNFISNFNYNKKAKYPITFAIKIDVDMSITKVYIGGTWYKLSKPYSLSYGPKPLKEPVYLNMVYLDLMFDLLDKKGVCDVYVDDSSSVVLFNVKDKYFYLAPMDLKGDENLDHL